VIEYRCGFCTLTPSFAQHIHAPPPPTAYPILSYPILSTHLPGMVTVFFTATGSSEGGPVARRLRPMARWGCTGQRQALAEREGEGERVGGGEEERGREHIHTTSDSYMQGCYEKPPVYCSDTIRRKEERRSAQTQETMREERGPL
jgi:hypothetical protein